MAPVKAAAGEDDGAGPDRRTTMAGRTGLRRAVEHVAGCELVSSLGPSPAFNNRMQLAVKVWSRNQHLWNKCSPAGTHKSLHHQAEAIQLTALKNFVTFICMHYKCAAVEPVAQSGWDRSEIG